MGNDVGGPIASRGARDMHLDTSVRCIAYTGGVPVKVSTDGNDTTPVITETYIAEVYVPAQAKLTGFANFNGSVASGNLKAILYAADGRVVASSASTAMAGTDAYQRIPFAAPVVVPPGRYYVGVQFDNTTARFNTHTIGNHGQAKKTGEVYGTPTSIAALPPPTTFTTNVGPMGSLY